MYNLSKFYIILDEVSFPTQHYQLVLRLGSHLNITDNGR